MPEEINRDRLQGLVIEAANLLDNHAYGEWLSSLCAPSFKYEITADSDEIGKKRMLWMSEDRTSLGLLMENVRFHEQYPGRLRRHVGQLRSSSQNGKYQAETPVTIWNTDSSGVTQLFAIGRYIDEFSVDDGAIRFANREVALDTRRFPHGCLVAL